MDFPPPVRRSGAIELGIPEHARQGRDAQPLDSLARKEPRLDFHGDGLLLAAYEAIGPGDAGAVEKRIDRHRIAGRLEIEMREDRKLLGIEARVDRQAARRQAVLVEFAGGAEIACALECQPVAAKIGIENAKACEADIGRKLFGKGSLRPEGEEIGAIEDLARRPVGDYMNVNAFLGEFVRMEEPDGRSAARKNGPFWTIVNLDLFL